MLGVCEPGQFAAVADALAFASRVDGDAGAPRRLPVVAIDLPTTMIPLCRAPSLLAALAVARGVTRLVRWGEAVTVERARGVGRLRLARVAVHLDPPLSTAGRLQAAGQHRRPVPPPRRTHPPARRHRQRPAPS